MAKNSFSTFTDTDSLIRQLLIEKYTYPEIKKKLKTSDRRISEVKKAMLAGEPIRRTRFLKPAGSGEKEKGSNESTATLRTPEEVETLRKDVEYRALEAMQEKLKAGNIEIKEATAILNVVGTKPKAESGDLTVIIQSINNFGSEARKRMIERMAAEKQVIDVSPEVLSDTNEPAAAVPENPDKGYDATQ